jgi:putative DNA-invertase from lambdoid prophage Rac
VEKRRLVTETVSGSSAIEQRPGFVKLLDRLERDDVLVVTKLDRLGRNSIDVQQTVTKLEKEGVRVHCLALGCVNLTSPAGKMTMGVIAAVAQFEKDLLIERTLAGQARAKAEGKKFGRPAVLTDESRAKVLQRLADGASISAVAREMKASRATIMRVGRAARTLSLTGRDNANSFDISHGAIAPAADLRDIAMRRSRWALSSAAR